MNGGPSEEAGSTARSAIDAMKGNPSCLAAIILASIFAVLTFWAMQKDEERKSKTINLLLTHCIYPGPDKPVREPQ